jgi:hypothetical protein
MGMKNMNHAFLSISLLALALSANAQVTPDSTKTYENRWNRASDALSFAKSCSPTLQDATYTELLQEALKGQIRTTKPKGDPNYLLFSIDGIFCIPQAASGFPILPAQILKNAFTIDGMTPEASSAMYQSVTNDIAKKGSSVQLFVHPTGTAVSVNFRVNNLQPHEFFVVSDSHKPGTFEKEQFPNTHMVSFRSTSISVEGAAGKKSLVSGVTVDRPLIAENFLAAIGTPNTTAFSFDNTRWKFMDNNSVIELQSEGKVLMKPQNGKQSEGTWKVQDGVILINYGRTFLSGTVENGDTLILGARVPGASRTDMTAMNPGQIERRWNFKIKRV